MGSVKLVLTFAAATLLAPAIAAAATPLPVYGGPTYSASSGGYRANHASIGESNYAYVNNTGTAAATEFKYGSGGVEIGLRAIRWSAASFVELGGEPTSVFAEGINNAGTVIGEATALTGLPAPYDHQTRPAHWPASGTAATILEHPYIQTDSLGLPVLWDINDAGTVVGQIVLSSRNELNQIVNSGPRAARWDASGTALTQLGNLGIDSDGYAYSAARAINGAGTAVGFAQKYDNNGNYLGSRALRWNAGGTAATVLGHLGEDSAGGTNSFAYAINNAGTVAGTSDVYDVSGVQLKRNAPVRWDFTGAPTELGTGPTPDAVVATSPSAINDAGRIVGAAGGLGAVRWDPSGTEPVQLSSIGGSFAIPTGGALAVNAAGTAVGWSENFALGTDLPKRAVYWGNDRIAIDLNTLIDPNSGWLLNRASGISDTGWIVGLGTFDPDGPGGQAAYSRHFLMQVPATVPEPTGALTLLIGVISLLRRGRVRQ